jgi:hypothetical protein
VLESLSFALDLGRLASASEVAGGHTILWQTGHALLKMVSYVLLRRLRPELDGRPSEKSADSDSDNILKKWICPGSASIEPA